MKEIIVKKRDKIFIDKQKSSYQAFKKIISKQNQKMNIQLLKEIFGKKKNF